jgi:mRNA interferase MazF
VRSPYVPDRGDVVWIDFDPQAGHEQAGRRPALVVSPATYNARAGLALFCPVTRQVKGYPFEVRFPEAHSIVGVVLADQVKNLDWRARRAAFHERAPEIVVDDVLEKLSLLVGPA